MKRTYKIYPKVKRGKNIVIGDFVIIGEPPRGAKAGEFNTVIGDNAVIRSHTVIYAGNRIGDNFQTGHHVVIRESNEIGNNVSIGTNSVVEHHIKIGNNVRMHGLVLIAEYSVLEDGCWLGPSVVLTNVFHPLCPKAKECLKGPTIKKGAKIGGNATLLPDIVIGENALVGANALVVRDVPPNKVVAGNPAKVIKDIKDLKCPYGLIAKPYSKRGAE